MHVQMVARATSFTLQAGLLLIAFVSLTSISSSHVDVDLATRMAHEAVASARSWAWASMEDRRLKHDSGMKETTPGAGRWFDELAFADCVSLYEDSELRLRRLISPKPTTTSSGEVLYGSSDARTWLSAAMTGHATCIEGLGQRNMTGTRLQPPPPANITEVLRRALDLHTLLPSGDLKKINGEGYSDQRNRKAVMIQDAVQLGSWDASKNKADIIVAQDGSGDYTAINDAVTSIKHRPRQNRLIIYIKSGIYKENIEIDGNMSNIMFVGDGINKTIITGNRSVTDGFTTISSATLRVSVGNFWCRDMTFENTAGSQKQQAVATMVASDQSIFYRCSFRGYQDTLFMHSLRQFYRDCQIYGTIDFIFGNAAAVVQNCDIYLRKPMDHQSNMITAQGRDYKSQNTGISIHRCRVLPDSDFEAVKGSFQSYLGRPWKKYSRTVFMETDIDGMINPEGWAKWSGSFALDTLYYGEYKNTGEGASTSRRVSWPGFHVLNYSDANRFIVERFIEGNYWIPQSGVPFWSGL